MRRRWLLLVAITVGAVLVDQVTKALVVAYLPLNAEWAPIPALSHLFAITYTTNTGAVFGIFPDAGAVFLVIALVVVGLIIYFYRSLPDGGWLIRVALGLQLAGALGNFIDRVRLGYVVDFIHVKFWPVFNVADSCIVIGVGVLVLALLLDERAKPVESNEESEKERTSP